MTTEAIIKCGNCDRTIGRLEARFAWQQFTVCSECFTRLSGGAAAPVVAAPAPVQQVPPPQVQTQVQVPPVYGTQASNASAVVQPPVTASAATTSHATGDAATAHEEGPHVEKIVFQGHPSMVIYIGSLSLAAIVTVLSLVGMIYFRTGGWGAAFMFYVCLLGMFGGLITFVVRYLQIEFIKYRLSNQRLFITTGILSRKTVETELFRVRDISVHQSLIERMLGIGTIRAITTDKDIPEMNFRGIVEPLKVKESLRQHVMEARQRTRTRDLDVADVDQNGNIV